MIRFHLFVTLAVLVAVMASPAGADDFRPVPLTARVTRVQPMTGIVLWADNAKAKTDAIQLEYSYVKYADLVPARDTYDWTAVEKLLGAVAGRGHQAVLRFYDVYVGQETTVPAYIKALADYKEVRGTSEKKPTAFSDWSHPELRRFALAFYSAFAAKYDADPRLAFVETGFGLWAEYHIYDGPMELGRTFPAKTYQAEFARHLTKAFTRTPWMISVDAAGDHAPFAKNADLLKLPFGVFDDSFLCKQHPKENEPNWNALGRERWKTAPAGGEFSYYTKADQKNALAAGGPNGVPFDAAAAAFHVTFMIGNDQLKYQKPERLREAGLSCGYRFRITRFEAAAKRTRLTVTNAGVAPLYHDAFPAVNGVRAADTLKDLLPGASKAFEVASGGGTPVPTIESDRLVKGQRIEFEADLK